MSFAKKVVLVTGAGSGIGAGIAKAFAKQAANVAIVGRNEEKLINTSNECEKFGIKPLIIKADITKEDDATRIVSETLKRYKSLDVLINNAGIGVLGSLKKGNLLRAYDEVINTNLRAIIQLSSIASPYLIESKGNIINISSTAGNIIPKASDYLPYCISKSALNHFSKGIALELASSGVRVNIISPGPVKTDIINNFKAPITWEKFATLSALGKVAEVDEIAELSLFLASDKAKSITGSNFVIDNGYLLKN